ncbi:MAG: LamG domain-containing protein, partial [Bacteroidales bacterium]|nr:LamG domain-containing protein [Bacteroidales bacterium]
MKNTKNKLIGHITTRDIKAMRPFYITILALLCPFIALGQLSPEPQAGFLAGQAVKHSISGEPGLLFYLSGDHEFRADFTAGGQDKPNYLRGLQIIQDGAIGKAFEAEDDQLMSYWAPGNIYAQRGTLSFYWRSRYPVGPTPFPVFRVAFADHTSWDMAWLRIDYNGSGFDAFVTDVGLARTRVSHYLETFPDPLKWTHIAFSWDETEGVRLYIDGNLVESTSVVGKVYDTGLDQFGPHSRIISPYQVQSMYNFMRGGDMDELRIYDRMLSDRNIADLSKGNIPEKISPLRPDLNERRWRDAWWDRHGWNLPNDPPPELLSGNTTIKKVGIHEAYDVKRWMWKANDGIRETTWPGVYNMSRLPGRYDYFVYPDWDCYSMSGQSIKFLLPEEPWNHIEVWGKAWGQLTWEKEHAYDFTFGVRTKEQVKSYHRLHAAARGGTIRFDNALIEEPIGELGVYNVSEGSAPEGSFSETFTLQPVHGKLQDESLERLAAFIAGRYPAGERTIMTGTGLVVETGPGSVSTAAPSDGDALPFIHMIIPYNNISDHGLDGLEIEIPALPVAPTHSGLFPMNIRVKDPLWPMRDLADFSFSVKPNTAFTLWIDTRDRILPEGLALYITLAGAGKGLS